MPSVSRGRRAKPIKPYPSFPLTPHPNGQWVKKIRGKLYHFGAWDDPHAALARYEERVADIRAGRVPRTAEGAQYCTVKELANRFLKYQSDRVAAGQIHARSFEDYRRVLRHFAQHVSPSRAAEHVTADELIRYRAHLVRHGLTGRKGLGVHALGRTLTILRMAYFWAESTGLIDRVPRWGEALAKPTAADRRRSRAKREREHGKNLLTPAEIRMLLGAADLKLQAAILLGINGGFGNTDCAALPIAALDLDGGVGGSIDRAIPGDTDRGLPGDSNRGIPGHTDRGIPTDRGLNYTNGSARNGPRITFERPKTAVLRVVPLWDETVAALEALLSKRRPAIDGDAENLVFRTESGRPLVRDLVKHSGNGVIKRVTYVDRLGKWFQDLLVRTDLKKPQRGFYTLRHVFRTFADEVRDNHAVSVIMGHAIEGMAGHYIEEIGFDRLRAVVDHVHGRIFESGAGLNRPAL